MIKDNYKRVCSIEEDFDGYSADLGDNTLFARQNHGVGIIGGYYKKDFPLCMVRTDLQCSATAATARAKIPAAA